MSRSTSRETHKGPPHLALPPGTSAPASPPRQAASPAPWRRPRCSTSTWSSSSTHPFSWASSRAPRARTRPPRRSVPRGRTPPSRAPRLARGSPSARRTRRRGPHRHRRRGTSFPPRGSARPTTASFARSRRGPALVPHLHRDILPLDFKKVQSLLRSEGVFLFVVRQERVTLEPGRRRAGACAGGGGGRRREEERRAREGPEGAREGKELRSGVACGELFDDARGGEGSGRGVGFGGRRRGREDEGRGGPGEALSVAGRVSLFGPVERLKLDCVVRKRGSACVGGKRERGLSGR